MPNYGSGRGRDRNYSRNRNHHRENRNYEKKGYKRTYHNYNEMDEKNMASSLIMLILKVGDKMTSTLENNLEALTDILIKDYSSFKDTVVSALKTCIVELPHKTSIYGVLVAFLLLKDKEIGTQVINSLFESFVTSIEKGDLRSTKIWLRFIGELTNTTAVSAQNLLSIYEAFLVKISQAKTKDLADSMMYPILGSLPWSGRTLSNSNSEALDNLMDRMAKYMELRQQVTDTRVDLFKPFKSASEDAQLDELELLWMQVKSLQVNEWELPELFKPYLKFDQFATIEQFALPDFQFPEKYPIDNLPLPKQTFCIFPEHFEIFKTASYYIISDVIGDLIDIFNVNRREAVKVLFSLRESYAIGTFLRLPSDHPTSKPDESIVDEGKEGTNDQPVQEEQIKKEEEEGTVPEPMEEGEEASPERQHNLVKFIIESIVRKTFELPRPVNKIAYYGSLAIEMVKTHEEDSAELFNEAFNLLFKQCNDMDAECVDRYYNFLARHISNFGFAFKWENWSSVLEVSKLTNQHILVSETLEKLIRLSYYDRIKNSLPEGFLPLLSTRGKPNFSFNEQGKGTVIEEVRALVNELKKLYKERSSFEEVQGYLTQAASDPKLGEKEVTQVAIEIILLMGKKSFSHLMNAIESNLTLLKSFTATEPGCQMLIDTVSHFWKEYPQWMTICFDKLLSYHILNPVAIVKSLFTSLHEDQYHRCYVWEILYGTMIKAEIWVTQQRTQYEVFTASANFSNKPAEKAEELLTTLNHAISDFKLALFEVYQGFCSVLQKRLTELYATQTSELEDLKFQILVGRMKEFARRFAMATTENLSSLEVVVFTDMMDERILNIFSQVKALKESPALELPQ